MNPEVFEARLTGRTPEAAMWKLQSISRASALFVIGFCSIVFMGWVFDIPALTSIVPGFARMSVPTATCFILSGVSLYLLSQTPMLNYGRVVQKLCAGIVLLIGAYAFVFYLETPQLSLARADPNSGYIFGHALGRVAPATALNFVLAAIALLLGRTPLSGRIFAIIVAIGLIITGLDLAGYAYQVEALYKVMPFSAMSLPTAIAFALLFLSALLARPLDGWTRRIVADDSGGFVARRLLPGVIAVPIVLGWLMKEANEQAIFDAPFGFAVFAVATVVLLEIMAVLASSWLAHRDSALRAEIDLREQAQDRLQMQFARLSLLNQITRAIGDRLDLRSIFQIVIGSLEDKLPVDFACFCLYDAVRDVLTVDNVGIKSRAFAQSLALPENAVLAVDQNGLSRCVQGQLVYEPDVREIDFPFPQRLAGAGLRAQIMSPLIVEHKVFGVLVIARLEASSFTSSDCEFMTQLSEHVALAIQQAQLHNSLQQAYDDLRQTQQAVMQQERLSALGQMASGIAHDINNAISPVSLYTEALLEDEPDLNPRTRSYLETVGRVINDIAATVARMREFYRQNDDQKALVPIDLNNLARQTIDLTRARWSDMPQRRGIVIEMHAELAPDLPRVMGIDNEIREALTNLIFNAVDALPDGGTITVLTEVQSDPNLSKRGDTLRRVRLDVADTGIGMDEDTRRRCLEPFFTTKGERGTGLGLAMVYGTLQRHNADIEIDSTVGKGTAMRITFLEAVAGATESKQPVVHEQLRPLRILFVDDDPLILESMCMFLEREGHKVTLASGGQAGIDAVKTARAGGTPFDVVFTDLGMPHVDGSKVARATKELSPTTQVILLTGWGQRLGDQEPNADIDFALGKPPQRSALREALIHCAARLKS